LADALVSPSEGGLVVVLEGEMASVSPAREGFAVSPRFSRERKQELRGKENGEPEGSPFLESPALSGALAMARESFTQIGAGAIVE
jgi:hypothetical protein